MATVSNNKFNSFMHLFNYGVPNIMEPREEEPVSLNIIDGDNLAIYKSSNSEKQMNKLALSKISHTKMTKQMKIIEPDVLFDYNFFAKNICSIFKSDESRIQLKQINLTNRTGDVSTYSITADVYPEIYSILKEGFSLERLYYAFVGATDEEKKIIIDYLNSLKFIRVNNINYYKAKKIANEEEIKFLNLDEMYEERLESTLIEATRNSYIIGMFNIDNPLLEIPTPVSNAYTDTLMSFKKLTEEKNAQQLQKKLNNFSKWLGDIDE